eukprot:8233755-Alexandrium_andersonii.AAC.1
MGSGHGDVAGVAHVAIGSVGHEVRPEPKAIRRCYRAREGPTGNRSSLLQAGWGVAPHVLHRKRR